VKSEVCKIFHEKRCRTIRKQRNSTGLRGAAAKKYLGRRNDRFFLGKICRKARPWPIKKLGFDFPNFLCVFPSSNFRNLGSNVSAAISVGPRNWWFSGKPELRRRCTHDTYGSSSIDSCRCIYIIYDWYNSVLIYCTLTGAIQDTSRYCDFSLPVSRPKNPSTQTPSRSKPQPRVLGRLLRPSEVYFLPLLLRPAMPKLITHNHGCLSGACTK